MALGVLGVAVAALVLDNLPGPQSASANGAKLQSSAEVVPERAATPGESATQARASGGQQRALAQLMSELRVSHEGPVRDVFVSREPETDPQRVEEVSRGTTDVDPRKELAGVRISAVAAERRGSRGGRALIDGRVVRPGDEVRGWRVVEIRLDGVLLRREDGAEALLGFSVVGRE
ncbi:MAG: hypothetical protein EA378_05425 [Phycisphaerales bacterium]|nr:MAG: hypothetical protein EA378_05425 [Phycisphaerales bacterium]